MKMFGRKPRTPQFYDLHVPGIPDEVVDEAYTAATIHRRGNAAFSVIAEWARKEALAEAEKRFEALREACEFWKNQAGVTVESAYNRGRADAERDFIPDSAEEARRAWALLSNYPPPYSVDWTYDARTIRDVLATVRASMN